MRGRTLNHSFIILDEAQNTTPEQMKMFLTRIGFGTKAVITGDVTQIDLARGQKSGLIEADRILARRARHRVHALHQRRRRAPPAGAEDHRRLRARRTSRETDDGGRARSLSRTTSMRAAGSRFRSSTASPRDAPAGAARRCAAGRGAAPERDAAVDAALRRRARGPAR